MPSLAFDTYKVAEELRKHDFSEKQTKGLAHILGGAATDHLATRADLMESEGRLENKINDAKTEHKDEINAARTEHKDQINGLKDQINGLKIEIGNVRTEMHKNASNIIKHFYIAAFGIALAVAGIVIGTVGILPLIQS